MTTRLVRAALLGLVIVMALPSMVVAQGPTDDAATDDAATDDAIIGSDEAIGSDAVIGLSVRGSPIIVGASGSAGSATITVELSELADLRLRITDFDGRTVRKLIDGGREAGTYVRRWKGKDDAGHEVPLGPYKVVATATADGSVQRAEDGVTVAMRKVYPRRPGFITVVLDAGHGGSRPGAKAADGTREADLNLDIALRAAAMLEGAGVNVVLTRDNDANVNESGVDRTRDGVADDTDELAARTDIANPARADLYISVHNNTAVNKSVGGPSTFFSDVRTYSGRSARLARIIQDEMVDALAAYSSSTWEPFDHGALTYPYYVLRDYDPPRLLRPTQMPAVLSEGMFVSNPRELRLLKRPLVRQAMAVAYYDAIAKYLARRSSHVGYTLVSGPLEVSAGETATFEVEIRDPGNTTMQGWKLAAGAIREPFMYEGRGRRGATVGQARIPRIRPGEKKVVSVQVTAPDRPGEWVLIFDARDRDGARLSRLGAPALQVPLTVTELELQPEPEPRPA